MTRILALVGLVALAACAAPEPEAAPEEAPAEKPKVSGSVSVGPGGVRPNVGLGIGRFRIGPGGVRVSI